MSVIGHWTLWTVPLAFGCILVSINLNSARFKILIKLLIYDSNCLRLFFVFLYYRFILVLHNFHKIPLISEFKAFCINLLTAVL
jgi:hypothetical protein